MTEFRLLRLEDLPLLLRWEKPSDPRLRHYSFYDFGLEELKSWYFTKQRMMVRKIYGYFVEGYPVGFITLKKINFLTRSAEIGLAIDPGHYGKGYGTAMIQEMLNTAYEVYQLETISLKVAKFNQIAQRCYRKLGFMPSAQYQWNAYEHQENIGSLVANFPEDFRIKDGVLLAEFLEMNHKRDTVVARAYAKVNLGLSVGEQREDGYHDLVSLMHSVDLHDVIAVRPLRRSKTKEIVLHGDDIGTSKEENLVYRAARMLQECYGLGGMELSLLKRIPIGAGLGGGSSDCAATINAINQLYQLGLTEAQREALGAKLGADVPFCIVPGAAIAQGMGEILERFLPQRVLGLRLVKTRASLATKAVFAALDQSRPYVPADWLEQAYKRAAKLKAFLMREQQAQDNSAQKDFLQQSSTEQSSTEQGSTQRDCTRTESGLRATSDFLKEVLHNDFEPISAGMVPHLADLRMALESISPVVAMTGSGPTMYSVDFVLSKEEVVRNSFVQSESPFAQCLEHFRNKYHAAASVSEVRSEVVERQERRIAKEENPNKIADCEAMCSVLLDLEIWLKVKTVQEGEPMLDWGKGRQRRKDAN